MAESSRALYILDVLTAFCLICLSALCDFNPLTLCTCKILLPVRWNIREHLLVLSCVRRRPIDAVVYVNKGRYRFSQEQLYEKTTWWQARQSGVCICLCAWLKAAPLCTNYICLSWSFWSVRLLRLLSVASNTCTGHYLYSVFTCTRYCGLTWSLGWLWPTPISTPCRIWLEEEDQ